MSTSTPKQKLVIESDWLKAVQSQGNTAQKKVTVICTELVLFGTVTFSYSLFSGIMKYIFWKCGSLEIP